MSLLRLKRRRQGERLKKWEGFRQDLQNLFSEQAGKIIDYGIKPEKIQMLISKHLIDIKEVPSSLRRKIKLTWWQRAWRADRIPTDKVGRELNKIESQKVIPNQRFLDSYEDRRKFYEDSRDKALGYDMVSGDVLYKHTFVPFDKIKS